MKKFVSLALALVMCLSLCVPAFAENTETLHLEQVEASVTISNYVSKKAVDLPMYQMDGSIATETIVYYIVDNDTLISFDLDKTDETLSAPLFGVSSEGEGYYSGGITDFDSFNGWYDFHPASYFDEPDVGIMMGVGLYNNATYYSTPRENGTGVDWDLTDKVFIYTALEEIPGSRNVGDSTAPETPAGPEKPTEKPAQPNSPFTDVPNWCAEPVAWAVEKKITNGTSTTTFGPSDTCNTAQIMTFLWRANGAPSYEVLYAPYTDVTNFDAYYFVASLWAHENNLVPDAIFGEKNPCTRAQVVTYLWKLAGSPAMDAPNVFTDVADDADYAQAVLWAVQNDITKGKGSDSTFAPDDTCTRGEIVTFLYRAYAE